MEAIPKHQPTSGAANRTTGRCGRSRQPAETLPGQHAAPAFLTHRFLPLVADHPVLRANRRVQGEFFRSVDNLISLYHFAPPELTNLPYPLNIHAVFTQLKRQLKRACPALSLAVLQTKEGIITLATVKFVDLQGTLYYIPLLPIFRLLRREKARRIVPIMSGIAAYIRQKMGLPCYNEWDTYIGNVHGILEQWVDDTEGERDERESADYYREFRRAEKVGYFMQRKLRQPTRITRLPCYLHAFKPIDAWQTRLQQLVVDFLQLDLTFPDRCLFKEIPTGFLEEEVKEEDRVGKNQYLSFVYDVNGWLGQEMIDYVETSLQECPVVDAPVSIQYFHQPQAKERHDSTYEETCLRLLNEFAHLLNNIDDEKY